MSEGRGTTTPFQVIGAPFIDANEYAQALNDLELPGVTFRPAYFTPTFSKHTNVLCKGVQVHVTDRETFMAVKTGWAMLEVVRTMYPNDVSILNGTSDRCMLNLLTGNNYLNDRTYSLEEQFAILLQDTATFSAIREDYLLYS
jgi:beta-N-acetylhexosaminidase